MIKTIPADYQLILMIGLTFGWSYKRLCTKASYSQYYGWGLIYISLFCLPLALYCYLTYPDWCWMYWRKANVLRVGEEISAFLFYYLFFSLGFSLSFILEKIRCNLSLYIIGALMSFFLIFSIVFYSRLFYVGTMEEFRLGTIKLIFYKPTLFLIVTTGIAIAFLGLIFFLIKIGNRFDYQFKTNDKDMITRKKKVVAVVKVEDSIKSALINSLNLWCGIEYLKETVRQKGDKIIVKPNLAGGGRNKLGSQTHPEVLKAVIEILQENIPSAQIIIGEGDSILWKVEDILRGSVYEQIFKEKGVMFVNLSKDKRTLHNFGGRLGEEEIPQTLYNAKVIIDVPVVKTHYAYKMSTAIKNLFGFLPYKQKMLCYHTKGFADIKGAVFIDIYRNFPPDLVIIDGMVSLEGPGPLAGDSLFTNFIITSDCALCSDLVCAKIMNYTLEDIPYLKYLLDQGISPDYNLIGVSIDKIKPKTWKHPRWASSLLLSFFTWIYGQMEIKLKRNV